MFDLNTTITFPIRTTHGLTDVTIRWPTDEEWLVHRKHRRLTQRQLGRGNTLNDLEPGDSDLKLYETIKLNGAPPLTLGEAERVIQTIGRCDVTDVELGSEEAEVSLGILTGPVKHILRIPTMDEIKTLQKTTKYVSLPYNVTEIRPSLEAAARLWDTCKGRSDGYANGIVPNVHKDAVIKAVIEAIEAELRAPYDEANF